MADVQRGVIELMIGAMLLLAGSVVKCFEFIDPEDIIPNTYTSDKKKFERFVV